MRSKCSNPRSNKHKKYQIRIHKEFDHTVVNKTGEGLLMMMMVKKCIWNVQPDAAAHFFPSTQSMNHRADENAPRRCTRFFSSYLTGLHYDELFFEQASAVRIHSGQKGYQYGLYCLLHTVKLWVEARLIDVVLAISILIWNNNECFLATFFFFCKCFCLFFDFLSMVEDISWKKWVISGGHFYPREVLFLGEFSRDISWVNSCGYFGWIFVDIW